MNKLLLLIAMSLKFCVYGVFLQCLFMSILFAHNGVAQKVKALDDVDIIIGFERTRLFEVFEKLESKTEFKFSYFETDLPDRKINLNYASRSMRETLFAIAQQAGVKFKRINNIITVDMVPGTMNKQERQNLVIEVRPISGKVTSNDGEALPGVNVLVQGTGIGTITDVNGDYKIDAPDNATTLVFSYVGYLTEEVVIDERSVINVTLMPDIETLSEIVVVGYGTQKKVNLTGAVGTVTSENIEARPVTNVQELLQGKTPGLNITNDSGAPGSGAAINIRGTSTIGGSSGVFVIIDGVPGNIFTLNPNDIESISVLKDAASAAIYGSRAANGVLLVTTKSGNKNKGLQVSWTSNIGIQNPLHFIDFVGAEDFMALFNIARVNEGASPEYDDQDFENVRNGTIPDHIWYKDMFEKNQIISTNHLSLSGKTQHKDASLT